MTWEQMMDQDFGLPEILSLQTRITFLELKNRRLGYFVRDLDNNILAIFPHDQKEDALFWKEFKVPCKIFEVEYSLTRPEWWLTKNYQIHFQKEI